MLVGLLSFNARVLGNKPKLVVVWLEHKVVGLAECTILGLFTGSSPNAVGCRIFFEVLLGRKLQYAEAVALVRGVECIFSLLAVPRETF